MYTYDKLGNVLTENNGTLVKTYGYDNNGNRTSANITDGTFSHSTTYTYDNNNRLTKATGDDTNVRYTYDNNNRVLTQKSYLNSSSTVKSYTVNTYYDSGLLKTKKNYRYSSASTSRNVDNITLTYYADGNIATVDNNNAITTYVYDRAGRLESESIDGVTLASYTYDAFGNRATMTNSEGVNNYTYDKNNRLTQSVGTSYSYDANGNLLSKSGSDTSAYTFDLLGRMIVEEEQNGEQRAEYGQYILKNLSAYLTENFGKGYSQDNLKLMRKFYTIYSQDVIGEIVFPQSKNLPSTETGRKFYLSWSHYLKLMRIDNVEERHFYEIEAVKNDWSLSELKRQFNTSLYERLALSTDKENVKRLSTDGQIIETPSDLVKDPYVLEFLGLPELAEYSETELEKRIIDNLQKFLLELGKGFTFVGRQVRLTFEEEHFRCDLVFYNRLLKCFVLFDLKIGELKHQDIGQMQMYVNFYDRNVKLDDENKTIGIILCKDKNQAVVEMTLPEDNTQIFASKYQTILPSKDELRKLLEN